ADLPAPTLIVMAMSEWVVAWWWAVFLALIGTIFGMIFMLKRSAAFRYGFDRIMLKFPVIGGILEKATIARWTRTLQTMFAAGVPLVESLDAVGGAAGNIVFAQATKRIQTEVRTGPSLTNAMTNTRLFPSMVLQMTQIGEESGSLDNMLGKVADYFEREVDDAVTALSSLLEPIIIVFLGVVIGGLVVAMYLPIFTPGAVVCPRKAKPRTRPDAAVPSRSGGGAGAGRRRGPVHRQLPQRRHSPLAADAGARLAGAMRRIARRNARAGAAVQPHGAALGVSRVRPQDNGGRKHPRRVVARVARQVLGLRGSDFGPVSACRASGRAARRR